MTAMAVSRRCGLGFKWLLSGKLTFKFSLATTAQGEPRTYWTFGGSLMAYEVGSVSIEPINVFGRVGHDFNENIGIGFEGSFSMLEDELIGFDWSLTTTFICLKASMAIMSNEIPTRTSSPER